MPNRNKTSQAPGRPTRDKRGTSSGDPTDPRNADRPLATISDDAFLGDGPDARRLDRLLGEEDEEASTLALEKPFWDNQTIVAVSISVAVGTLIGVPIGQFLHSLGF